MAATLRRPLPASGSAEAARFLRFAAVGAGGFCVDAGVLMASIQALGLGPVAGRFLSFAAAVLATYAVNRAWAFRHRGGLLRGFGLYLGVQGLGFACNLAVYSALLVTLPRPWNAPLACLAAATAVALAVNYAGARLVVFRRP